MALAYLLDPQLQFSDKSGALNVAGFLRVYLNGTDDRAVTYSDFAGTLNQADIVLDNNGRAVVIADSSKAYRLEVYNREGALLWTQYPINTIVGGSGGTSGFVVESTDGTIDVDRYDSGGVVHYDLSATDNLQLQWTRTDSYIIEESTDGTFIVPVNQAEGNMTVDNAGIHLAGGMHYNVSVYVNIDSPSTAVNRFEGIKFRLGGINAPVAEYTVNDSFEHRQTACISCDIHPASDTVFKIHVDGVVNGSELSCNQCTIHSLASHYSGGGGGGGDQVQSDWTENDTESPAFIKHRPTEKPIVAGEGIRIYENTNDVTIESDVPQSDWTEDDSTDPSYIKHRPDQSNLYAGPGITITTSGSNTVISAGDIQRIQSDWDEINPGDPSYVKHKPTEKSLVAGTGISITETASTVTIETTGSTSGVPAVTSSDDGKLLKASYSGGTGTYSWQTVNVPSIGTVTI